MPFEKSIKTLFDAHLCFHQFHISQAALKVQVQQFSKGNCS